MSQPHGSRGSFLHPLRRPWPRFFVVIVKSAVQQQLPLSRRRVRTVVPLGDQIVDPLVLRLQLLVLARDKRLLRRDQVLEVGQRRTLFGNGLNGKNLLGDERFCQKQFDATNPFKTGHLPPDDTFQDLVLSLHDLQTPPRQLPLLVQPDRSEISRLHESR